MKGWKIVRIKDICDIKGGKRLPLGEDFSTVGYPYIRARDIKSGKIKIETPVYISGAVRDKIRRYTTQPNDILITIVGANIGDVGIVPIALGNANLTENAVKLTNHRGVHCQFLLYVLLSSHSKELMQQASAGAAQGKLGIYKINEIPVPLPPLPIQRKIAAILSAYDELIENNNRRIAILEKMAEEIYREWFVRLRFPGHEKVKVVKGVPEGWEVKKIGDVFQIKRGKVISSEELSEGSVPVIGGGVSFSSYHNKCNTDSPTITISASGANAGFINLYYEDVWASDCSFIDRTVTKSPYYAYLLLKSKQYEITYLQKGSAQPHVYAKDIMALGMLCPDTTLTEKFEHLINPIFYNIKCLKKSLYILKSTRDRLLPRLISSKLDVEHLDIAFPPGMKEEQTQIQEAVHA